MNSILLVDGHAYAYRAFYAIRDLRAPDGRATNAIFGFVKMLERARALVNPGHLAVIWDGGLDAGRVEALPGYKAQRPEMPDDLETQLDQIGAYLAAAGICSVCRTGVEADDLIATAACKAEARGCAVVIATSDKDFMQLVSARVRLLNPGDKQQPVWDTEKVVAKTGVQPAQIVDWLSLVGDAVDNIDGVQGVGPKTAAKLLNEYGTLEGVYQRLEQVQPERLRIALTESRDVVMRNRQLVRLKLDLDGAPDLEQCVPGPEDRAQLGRLFETWGFRTLAEKYSVATEVQELPL